MRRTLLVSIATFVSTGDVHAAAWSRHSQETESVRPRASDSAKLCSTGYVHSAVLEATDRCDTQVSAAMSRRRVFQTTLYEGSVAITLLASSPSVAQEPETAPNKKPYAPMENLLPAARVKVLIDRAFQIAKKVDSADLSATQKEELLLQLQYFLLEPRSFLTKQEASTAKRYLQVDTLSEWTKARQKEAENRALSVEGSTSTDPLARLNEGFEQWGERRQFGRLRRQQIALEDNNPMRAAFNSYTNNLVFGDSYVLTAGKVEKSRMIRQDRLPDVTSVIRSDLDLRDLYRNEVLTAMDDARAELTYQLRQVNESEVSLDASELVSVLSEAQRSCDKWFDFIPETDVKEAMERVLTEDGTS